MAEDNMSNIINNFKNMLQSNNKSNDVNSSNDSNSNNFNISPEMISNLASMLQSNNSQNTSNSSAENISFNNNPSIPNFSNNTSNRNENNSSSQTNNSDENNNSNIFSGNLDFETILKMKSIMETFNKKDDPRSNLLYSLKPYLRENKQKKLDQYVNLFKITQVTSLFKNEKGDGT